MNGRMPMNSHVMPLWLDHRAQVTPDKIALQLKDQTLTFRELSLRVHAMMDRLDDRGVGKGSRIATLLDHSIASVVLIHALQGLGAVHIFINTRLTPTEWAFQSNDSEATHLIYADDFSATDLQLDIKRIQLMELYDSHIPEKGTYPSHWVDQLRMSDVHSMMYTSGTTGQPKGVQLTNSNHWWSAVSSGEHLHITSDDVWLLCLPIYHVGGLSILLRSVILGFTVVMLPRFDAQQVNEAIHQYQVTVISVVSVMLQRMIDALEGERYPSSLRCVLVGGGPVPRPLLEVCRSRRVPVYQTYGLTETASQVVTLDHEHSSHKMGSAGKAVFPSQVKVIHDNKECQPHQIGEISLKGPTICMGYYRRPQENEKVFQDGWLYSGDLGYLDEEGYLYVVDRRADLIISGGENVYPAEIEAVLWSHPLIEDAGVTARPDVRWGQVPIAFIQTQDHIALTASELNAFCAHQLAKYKIPVTFFHVKQLPRNASQKLLRRELNHLNDAEEIL